MGEPESQALPGRSAVQVLPRIRRFLAAAPLPLRILLIGALCLLAIVLAGPLMLVGSRLRAVRGMAWQPLGCRDGCCRGLGTRPGLGSPPAALAARRGTPSSRCLRSWRSWPASASLGRWQIPCRTTAWALAWSLPVGLAAFRLARGEPSAGPALAWLIATDRARLAVRQGAADPPPARRRWRPPACSRPHRSRSARPDRAGAELPPLPACRR